MTIACILMEAQTRPSPTPAPAPTQTVAIPHHKLRTVLIAVGIGVVGGAIAAIKLAHHGTPYTKAQCVAQNPGNSGVCQTIGN